MNIYRPDLKMEIGKGCVVEHCWGHYWPAIPLLSFFEENKTIPGMYFRPLHVKGWWSCELQNFTLNLHDRIRKLVYWRLEQEQIPQREEPAYFHWASQKPEKYEKTKKIIVLYSAKKVRLKCKLYFLTLRLLNLAHTQFTL